MDDTPDLTTDAAGGVLPFGTYRECAGLLKDATECLDQAALCGSRQTSEVLVSRALFLALQADAVCAVQARPQGLADAWARRGTHMHGAGLLTGLPADLMGNWVEHVCGPQTKESKDTDLIAYAVRRLCRRMRRALHRRAPPWVRRCRILAGGAMLCAVLFGGAWQGWVAEFLSEGFLVTYYRDVDLLQRVSRKREAMLFRDYGESRPAFRVPRDRFSARWEGTLTVPESGNYVFFSQCKGGLRLWIDEILVLDQWGNHEWAASGRRGQHELAAGDHRLKVEYVHETGDAALRVRWAGGPVPPNTIIGVPYVHVHR